MPNAYLPSFKRHGGRNSESSAMGALNIEFEMGSIGKAAKIAAPKLLTNPDKSTDNIITLCAESEL